MHTPPATTTITFFRFLYGTLPAAQLEAFVYQSQELEQQLGKERYLQLIAFDYSQAAALHAFVKTQLIARGQYETWRLQQILQALQTDAAQLPALLQQLYDAYYGELQEDGSRKFAFRFLGHLALNYPWWLDVPGANETEYRKDYPYYQQQLTPFAGTILAALQQGGISIHDDGSYSITGELKAELESGTIYRLRDLGA